jgi:hypothetical protein
MLRSVPRFCHRHAVSPGLTGCPTGKSARRLTAVPLSLGARQRVEPTPKSMVFNRFPNFRNNACRLTQISRTDSPSHPERGALRNVINAGRGAVDADGAFDESA